MDQELQHETGSDIMRIALAQMEVVAGRPDKNLETMLSMIDGAKRKSADLIAFPEMCIGGYILSDKWTEDGFCLDLMEYEKEIINASNGIAVAYGNVHIDNDLEKRTGDHNFHPNKDGRTRKYNAARIFQKGEPAKRLKETKILPEGTQPKTHLPTYRIFDDERFYFSMNDVAKDFGVLLEELEQPFVIDVGGRPTPVGFELCEDLWCEDYRINGNAINPTKMLIDNGAELVVNLSASPWTYGKNCARDRRIEFLKKESGERFVPFLYVNCTGAQNNGKNIITFDGGSTVYNRDGKPVVFSSGAYEEELIFVDDADLRRKGVERVEEPRIVQKFKTIITGIRHMYSRYLIGVSGGLDSSVDAAMLCLAVGRGNVFGVNMPSRYNSDKTKDSARHVAEKLGIAYGVISIEEMVKVNQEAVDSVDLDGSGRKLSSFNIENVQAKIRGTSLLSNLAAKYNALFTSNGNKLEIALGYATLYGDWGGAIAPLGDLTKTEIVELAKYLNEEIFHDEVIPNALIPDELWRFKEDQIQPGAELKENHVSPIKFGYHCALINAITDYKKKGIETIMEWYIEGSMERNLGISTGLIKRWGMDDPKEFMRDLEWFYRTVQKNIFKRVQAPPIVMTSKSAYGYDIRESMLPYTPTKKFEHLKKKVLAMEEYRSR
jgi:NAD+ synthase (glutamine-hydrolysing)